jgi:hypothetical protein
MPLKLLSISPQLNTTCGQVSHTAAVHT